MGPTKEQIAFFNENGYLAVENVLNPEEIANYRRSAEALQAKAEGLTESTDRFRLQIWDEAKTQLQQVAEPHELGAEWMSLAGIPVFST